MCALRNCLSDATETLLLYHTNSKRFPLNKVQSFKGPGVNKAQIQQKTSVKVSKCGYYCGIGVGVGKQCIRLETPSNPDMRQGELSLSANWPIKQQISSCDSDKCPYNLNVTVCSSPPPSCLAHFSPPSDSFSIQQGVFSLLLKHTVARSYTRISGFIQTMNYLGSQFSGLLCIAAKTQSPFLLRECEERRERVSQKRKEEGSKIRAVISNSIYE